MNKTEADLFNGKYHSVPAKLASLITELTYEFQLGDKSLVADGKLGPQTIQALTKAPTDPAPVVLKVAYTVNDWTEYLEASGLSGKRLLFALKWIEVESGGNPCAIGAIGAKGPDGFPREMGIAQLYNPDDLKRFGGLKSEALRAYCATDGSSKCTRALTSTEMASQVAALLALLSECETEAHQDAHKAGLQWSDHDMACLTKLQHGLPGISRTGLPAVKQYLGRPPYTWGEFREALGHVKLDIGTERYRSGFASVLNNAEKTAEVYK